MSITIDQENKVISSLAGVGITFPVNIIYPDGRITYVTRMYPKKDIIVTPKQSNNVIQFPSKFNLEPA